MVNYDLLTKSAGYNVSQGMQVPLQYVNQITHGLFMSLFLGLLWLGITLASFFAQIRRKGDASILATASVTGLGVMIFMVILSIIPAITNKAYSALVSSTQLGIFLLIEIVLILLWFNIEKSAY